MVPGRWDRETGTVTLLVHTAIPFVHISGGSVDLGVRGGRRHGNPSEHYDPLLL